MRAARSNPVKANLPPFAQLLFFGVWPVAAVSCTCHCQFEYGPCHLLKETKPLLMISAVLLIYHTCRSLFVLTRTGIWCCLQLQEADCSRVPASQASVRRPGNFLVIPEKVQPPCPLYSLLPTSQSANLARVALSSHGGCVHGTGTIAVWCLSSSIGLFFLNVASNTATPQPTARVFGMGVGCFSAGTGELPESPLRIGPQQPAC